MICQVCKEDHRTLVNKEWCDRSLLEIENDYLKAENARLIEALEKISIMTRSQKLALSSLSFVVGLIIGLCMQHHK